MPEVGIEPTRISPREFESRASASSATPAYCFYLTGTVVKYNL